MSHPFTDEFGYPLTSTGALRWRRKRGRPMYVNGQPVSNPTKKPGAELAARLIAKSKEKTK